MIPGLRPFGASEVTEKMVSNFPGWMKIHDKDSIGYRFLEAIGGQEIDLVNRSIDYYSTLTNIRDLPGNLLTTFYKIDIEIPIISGIIYATDSLGTEMNLPIYLTEDATKFLSNPPTRMVLEEAGIRPSGLVSGIVGLEFVNIYPTGYLIIQDNVSSIDPSSTLYYHVESVNNEIDLIPFSGKALGVGTIGLDENSSYEILRPDAEWKLKSLYPTGVWIIPSSDIMGHIIPRIEYGDENYVPSGLPKFSVKYLSQQSYINEDGDKTYYYIAYNNPYGYNKYCFGDVQLTYSPISGTVKIMDIMNLTSSGTPTIIPASGINVYHLTSGLPTGMWEYKGYYSGIPESVLPVELRTNHTDSDGIYTAPMADYLDTVSWVFLPESGYIDDEVYPHGRTFQWIDGTESYDRTIRFSGGFSTYQVEYQYIDHEFVRGLTYSSRNPIDGFATGDGTLSFLDYDSTWRDITTYPSETTASGVRALCSDLRPGHMVKVLATFNAKRVVSWVDPSSTNCTTQFIQNNIGYTNLFNQL